MKFNRFLFLLVLFNLFILLLIFFNINQNGKFTYALDDAYIHLAIAKNVTFHNVWGITSYEVNFASSSPFYTLLLSSLMLIFGNQEFLPLIINIIAANLLIWVIYREFGGTNRIFIFVFLMLFVPIFIYLQIFSGMEHLLHCLFILIAIICYRKIGNENQKISDYLTFGFALLLATMTRYETMFFSVMLIALSVLRSNFKVAITTLIFTLIPIVSFGCYFYEYSGYFFPNTLLLKGKHEIGLNIISEVLINFLKLFNPYGNLFFIPNVVLLLLTINSFKYIPNRTFQNFIKEFELYFIVTGVAVMHTTFSAMGWLYRYEAYILLLYVFAVAVKVRSLKKLDFSTKKIKYGLYIFIVLLLINFKFSVLRTFNSARLLTFAAKNIHDQHVTVSDFVKKNYNTSKIAINDIGANAYFTDAHILDLTGLGSNKVMELKQKNLFNNVTFNQIIKDRDMMIIYDEWYKHYNFKGIKVAEMVITKNVICGYDRVSFYVFNENEATKLRTNLKEFERTLPHDIKVKYFDK